MSDRAGRRPIASNKKNQLLPPGKVYFFGIGINEYKHWPKLGNAVRDVKAVAEVLRTKYGVIQKPFLLDEQATREEIITQFDELRKEIQAPDSLIIYYAGHGYLESDTKRGFLVPANTEKESTAGLIRNSALRDYFQDAKAQHILFISDACFSGSLLLERRGGSEEVVLRELANRPSRWVMCSGRHNEEVADGPRDGHSPFAQALLDELQYNQKQGLNAAVLGHNVQLQCKSYYKDQLADYGPIYNSGDKRGQLVLWQKATDLIDVPPLPKLVETPVDEITRTPEQKPSDKQIAAIDIHSFKKQVNDYLIEDKPKEALAFFTKHIKDGNDISNDVALLQARLTRVKKSIRNGVISNSDSTIELNRINRSIKSLLYDIDAGMLMFHKL